MGRAKKRSRFSVGPDKYIRPELLARTPNLRLRSGGAGGKRRLLPIVVAGAVGASALLYGIRGGNRSLQRPPTMEGRKPPATAPPFPHRIPVHEVYESSYSPGNVVSRVAPPLRGLDHYRHEIEAITRYDPHLYRSISPYMDTLKRVAGKKYNLLTVLDTLSRVPPGEENLERELYEQRNAVENSLSESERARARRKEEILQNLLILRQDRSNEVDKMMDSLYKLKSRRIESIRRRVHGKGGENWRYGSFTR